MSPLLHVPLSPPQVPSAAGRSKVVVLLFINCLFMLLLHVGVLCLVLILLCSS